MKKWMVCLLATCLIACGAQEGRESPSEGEVSLMHLAENMKRSGDNGGAIRLYEEAISKSGNRVQAHMELADLYNSMKNPDAAAEVLLRAKERQNHHPLINLGLGKLAVAKGDATRAVAYFNDGLTQAPNNLDLINGKAVALDMLGRHDEAQDLYYKLLASNYSDTDFVQNNLALSLIMNGDYDEAISYLKDIENMEKSPVMRQNLALAYGLKGEMKKARQWGLKDLSKKEFEQNIKFYRNYTKKLKANEAR